MQQHRHDVAAHRRVNAAIIYQHTTREADHVIADALDAGMGAIRKAATGAPASPHQGNLPGLEGLR